MPPGTELAGRYRVVRLLGEGSMGAVYEAEHALLGRRVAVKVLHAKYARNPEAVSRFTREARAAAATGHPNIVDVTDFGAHGHQPFLVMELLKGETLAERMARTATFGTEAACRAVGQILSALDAAHALGIVHRDLKPENIFAGEARATSVKILDFGVSKFRPPGSRDERATRDGAPIGTPHYMAPEQWLGLRDVDHRADLFAVGVMLYELLTGGLAYEGATHVELCKEVVHGTQEPPAPSAIAPEVPEGLDPIVLRAVSRDRALRFQSAEEFLDALRPFGADAELMRPLPVLPASLKESYSSVAPARVAEPTLGLAVPSPRWSLRAAAARVASVVLAVSAGVGIGAWMFRVPPPATATLHAPSLAPSTAPSVVLESSVAPSVAPAPSAAPASPVDAGGEPSRPRRHRHRRHHLEISHEF